MCKNGKKLVVRNKNYLELPTAAEQNRPTNLSSNLPPLLVRKHIAVKPDDGIEGGVEIIGAKFVSQQKVGIRMLPTSDQRDRPA